jgi:hypothetical protein
MKIYSVVHAYRQVGRSHARHEDAHAPNHTNWPASSTDCDVVTSEPMIVSEFLPSKLLLGRLNEEG